MHRYHTETQVEEKYEESANKTQHTMDKYIPTKMTKGNRNLHGSVTKRLIRRRDKDLTKARLGKSHFQFKTTNPEEHVPGPQHKLHNKPR